MFGLAAAVTSRSLVGSAAVRHAAGGVRRPSPHPGPSAAAPSCAGSSTCAESKAETATAPEFERSASGFVSGPSRAVVVETKGARTGADVTVAAAERPADEQHLPEQGPGEADETWRPNELPLPTYVTAPKAIRPIKVIDLTSPGAWSSGRLLEDGLSRGGPARRRGGRRQSSMPCWSKKWRRPRSLTSRTTPNVGRSATDRLALGLGCRFGRLPARCYSRRRPASLRACYGWAARGCGAVR